MEDEFYQLLSISFFHLDFFCIARKKTVELQVSHACFELEIQEKPVIFVRVSIDFWYFILTKRGTETAAGMP